MLCYNKAKSGKDRAGRKGARLLLQCCQSHLFLDNEYSIILIDPPYADPSIGGIIERLANSKLVSERTMVVVTHSPRRQLEPTYASLNLIKEHRHGDSVIALYHKEAAL